MSNQTLTPLVFNGSLLREARRAKRISQEELARILNRSGAGAICNWERGRAQPPADVLEQLKRLLDIPCDAPMFVDHGGGDNAV